jgi:hypothetical protein
MEKHKNGTQLKKKWGEREKEKNKNKEGESIDN